MNWLLYIYSVSLNLDLDLGGGCILHTRTQDRLDIKI